VSSLNIASRALTTNLAALQVVGHNIANVNTQGYSRQTVEQRSAGAQLLGAGYFGKGVEIAAVSRAYDIYLTREAQVTRSVAASDVVRFQKLQQLEDLFPMGEAGLGVALNNALNAWVDVASAPTDLTARTVTIARAEELAARFRETASRIDELRLSARLQIESVVGSVNMLAEQLASLNKRIVDASGSGPSPNDLLDQRDRLVMMLSDHVQVSTVAASDGSVSVFVAGSQPLVVGSRASPLSLRQDPLDAQRVVIHIEQASGSFPINEDFMAGGELRGLLQYVNKDVPETHNTLGRLALSLAEQVNTQHRLGLDLYGNPGGDFFMVPALSKGYPAQGNSLNAEVSQTVVDPTQFVASDYEIRFSSDTQGTIVRLSDGKASAFNTANPATMEVDGLRFEVTGTPVQGDRFLMRPFESAARNIEVAVSEAQSLAAASPVLLVPDLQPGSGLTIESVSLRSGRLPVLPATLPELQLDYSAGMFTPTLVSGVGTVLSGPVEYVPGKPLQVQVELAPGNVVTYELKLRGSPAEGDSLNLTQGMGDAMQQNAGNAKAILGLRDVNSFQGVSLGDGYISVFSQVASKVQSGRFAAEFSTGSSVAAEKARSGVAGVNLDEEAARLIQYQQSYQASAKFLQVAQSTFDILIQSFGR
jgi:flagellar hook-associated protein 1